MGVTLFNETNKPTIIKDEIGSYCIKDIPCSLCEINGTTTCPNGNNSRPSYSSE